MTPKGWFAATLVAGGVVFSIKTASGCLNRPAPDQRLAGQFEDLCEIAHDGANNAPRGVRAFGRYLALHGGDMAKNLVDTVALIERIRDDEAHDERAELAHERLAAADCPEDWERFDRAIDESPEAQALIQEAAIRLNRTIEIIFGPGFTLRELPQRIRKLL